MIIVLFSWPMKQQNYLADYFMIDLLTYLVPIVVVVVVLQPTSTPRGSSDRQVFGWLG